MGKSTTLRSPVDFVVFVEGTGLAGRVSSFKHPDLELDVENAQVGGVLGKVAIPLDVKEMKCDLAMKDVNRAVMERFGQAGTKLIVRAAARGLDDVVDPLKITVGGRIVKEENGDWKPGAAGEQKFSIEVSYYKYEDGADVVHEFDQMNYKLIIGGKDLMADMRAAMGI